MPLLWTLAALAHSPHDVSPFAAWAPDGALLGAEVEMAAVSTDGAHTATIVGLPFRDPVCGFARSATSWLIAAEDVLFSTLDAGRSWSVVEGPTSIRRCRTSDAGLVAVGAEGIWSSVDGDTWAALEPPPGRFVDGVLVEDGGVLLAGDGLWAFDGSAWTQLDPDEATAVAEQDGQVAWAVADGLRARVDGVVSSIHGAPTGTRALAINAGELLAVTDDEGLWVRALDGNWTLEADGLDPLCTTDNGCPSDGVHYYDIVVGAQGQALATWEGLYARKGSGQRWQQAPLATLPMTNETVFLDDGRIAVGTRGGGMYLGVPYETDWEDGSRDVNWPWTRRIALADGAWLIGAGDNAYGSTSEGAHWKVLDIGLPTVGDAIGFSAAGTWLVAGRDEDGNGSLARSSDRGESFSVVVLPPPCQVKPEYVFSAFSALFVTCGTHAVMSLDDGASFAEGFALPARVAGAPAVVDEGGSPSVLVPTEDGLYAVSSALAVSLVAFEGQMVDAVAASADGSEVYAAVRGGGLWSLDAAGAATLTAWPFAEPVGGMAVGPAGELAVNGATGAWITEDGGASFALACPWDRYDDRDQTWFYDGFQSQKRAQAKAGSLMLGEVGARATWEVEGERIGLWLSGPAQLTLRLDGASETVDVGGDDALAFAWAANTEPGLHVVELEVESGTLGVDGGERWRVPVAHEAPEEEECGCAAGPTRGVFGAGAAGLVAGRRRRRAPS